MEERLYPDQELVRFEPKRTLLTSLYISERLQFILSLCLALIQDGNFKRNRVKLIILINNNYFYGNLPYGNRRNFNSI